MTVYFPDSPGDCPTGINLSVISCAEGAGRPPPRNTLIPTSATTNLRMVIRSPSSPSFDEERSRLLLLSDRLLRVPPSEEETPDGLVLEPPCLPEVGDGLRVKAAAPRSEEHTSELQSRFDLVCRLLLEKKKQNKEMVEKKLHTHLHY